MIHCSFSVSPVCPVGISYPLSLFSSASVFPFPLPSARSCLDLALPLSFSFPRGVCVRVQSATVWHHYRISSTALPCHVFPFAILNCSAVTPHQSLMQHALFLSSRSFTKYISQLYFVHTSLFCILAHSFPHSLPSPFPPSASHPLPPSPPSHHLSGMLMLIRACWAHHQTFITACLLTRQQTHTVTTVYTYCTHMQQAHVILFMNMADVNPSQRLSEAFQGVAKNNRVLSSGHCSPAHLLLLLVSYYSNTRGEERHL